MGATARTNGAYRHPFDQIIDRMAALTKDEARHALIRAGILTRDGKRLGKIYREPKRRRTAR